jgi:hypothetical protein
MSPRKKKEAELAEDVAKTLMDEVSGKKEKRPKVSSNNSEAKSLTSGAFIILIVMIAVSVLSLSLTTKSSKNIEVLGPQGITINVDLSSPVFREAYTTSSTPQYCNNPSPYKSISNSLLFISDANSQNLGSVKLGDAVKYNYISCKFKAFLPLEDSFSGGKVSVYVKFAFGESEKFTVDVGSQRPYKIDLKLNLG